MGVIQQLRDYRKTFWHRAVYVARTEGTVAMMRHAARFTGLAPDLRVDWQALPRDPSPLPASSRGWPTSVLVVCDGSGRDAQLARLAFPVLRRSPGDPGVAATQQLVAAVYVVGLANLGADLVAAARRLGQRLVVEVEPQDDPGSTSAPACDAILVAAARSLPEHWQPVLLPYDSDRLGAVLLGESP